MRFTIEFILVLIFPLLLLANDPAPHEGKEDKAEVKKTTSLPEWVELESRISATEAKVKSKESNINKLLEEKRSLDQKSPRLKDLIKELTSEHREMRAGAEDLEKQRTILKYRFPERGAKPDRKYKQVKVKSLEEMEDAIGVDGRLSKALQRVRQQYQVKPPAKPEVAKPVDSDPTEPSDIERSILLQK